MKLKKRLGRFNRIYYFPLALLVPVLVLTCLRISGTSAGYYHEFLYGDNDPALIHGSPLPIRSDEWLVNTPMILSQKHRDFPVINKSIGTGQDMSVIIDVPTKDWSTFFKPQNWPFFALPLEFAFALRWWLIAYLLIVSAYLFVLKFLPGKIWVAILLSISLFTSPFLQWWYQSISILPVAYALIGTLLAFQIIDRAKKKAGLIWPAAFLVYVLFAFILILYPPWQLACAWVAIGAVGGYLLRARPDKKTLKKIAMVAGAVFLCVAVLSGIFYENHKTAIKATNNTVYPGKRVLPSGGYGLSTVLSGYNNFGLEYPERAINYTLNQSEASNFILVLPFMIIPGLYVLFDDRKKGRKTDWLLVGAFAVLLLFTLNLFVPMPNVFGVVTLLNRVEHPRLLMGIGLLNFVFLIYMAHRLIGKDAKIKFPAWLVYGSGLFALVVVYLILHQTKINYPEYLSSLPKIIFISLWFAALMITFLKKRVLIAAAMLMIFSVYSSYNVNPLYRGLGLLTHSSLASYLSSDKASRNYPNGWVVYDIYPLNTLPAAEGDSEISGVYTYPQLNLWHQIDKGGHHDKIYNRYAHVFFRHKSDNQTLQYIQQDAFSVSFNPCGGFIKKHVDFILSSQPLTDKCLTETRTFQYPSTELFVYKIDD